MEQWTWGLHVWQKHSCTSKSEHLTPSSCFTSQPIQIMADSTCCRQVFLVFFQCKALSWGSSHSWSMWGASAPKTGIPAGWNCPVSFRTISKNQERCRLLDQVLPIYNIWSYGNVTTNRKWWNDSLTLREKYILIWNPAKSEISIEFLWWTHVNSKVLSFLHCWDPSRL